MTGKADQLTPDEIRAACEATGWREEDSSFSLTLLAMDCIRWFMREDVRARFLAEWDNSIATVYVVEDGGRAPKTVVEDFCHSGPPEIAWIKACAWAAGRMGEGKK